MLIWIGKRESDIFFSKWIFRKSVTFWGTNVDGNISINQLYNDIRYGSEQYFEILVHYMQELISADSEARFLFYNISQARWITQIAPSLTEYIIGNNYACHEWIRQKILFRIWAANYCETPPNTLLASAQCNSKSISCIYPSYSNYVVQANLSSGGEKTFLLPSKGRTEFFPPVDYGKPYLVSPYLEECNSYNSHLIITATQVVVLSVSLQIIRQTNHTFSYVGGDFSSREITQHIRKSICCASRELGEVLQSNGYRGIIGFDFLSDGNRIFALEANPRFQGSSILLDKELNQKLGLSLFEMHTQSFCEDYVVNGLTFSSKCLWELCLCDSRELSPVFKQSSLINQIRL